MVAGEHLVEQQFVFVMVSRFFVDQIVVGEVELRRIVQIVGQSVRVELALQLLLQVLKAAHLEFGRDSGHFGKRKLVELFRLKWQASR